MAKLILERILLGLGRAFFDYYKRPDNIFEYYQVRHMPALFYEKYKIAVCPEILLF